MSPSSAVLLAAQVWAADKLRAALRAEIAECSRIDREVGDPNFGYFAGRLTKILDDDDSAERKDGE